jgi:hypothetical protein
MRGLRDEHPGGTAVRRKRAGELRARTVLLGGVIPDVRPLRRRGLALFVELVLPARPRLLPVPAHVRNEEGPGRLVLGRRRVRAVLAVPRRNLFASRGCRRAVHAERLRVAVRLRADVRPGEHDVRRGQCDAGGGVRERPSRLRRGRLLQGGRLPHGHRRRTAVPHGRHGHVRHRGGLRLQRHVRDPRQRCLSMTAAGAPCPTERRAQGAHAARCTSPTTRRG